MYSWYSIYKNKYISKWNQLIELMLKQTNLIEKSFFLSDSVLISVFQKNK